MVTSNLQSGPIRLETCTPNDTTLIEPRPRALWIGTGGDLYGEVDEDIAPHLLKNVPSGIYLLGRWKRVYSTNTTADDILLAF